MGDLVAHVHMCTVLHPEDDGPPCKGRSWNSEHLTLINHILYHMAHTRLHAC